MSFKKTKVEGMTLTPALAQEFAELPPLPGEREEKPARRDFLLNHLREGSFGGPAWARGVCLTDGQVYRLDGQHSSKLLASLPDDVAFPDGLLVTIDTWEFDSVQHDAPALFDMFNHPRSARSNEDAMGLYKARVDSLQDVSRRLLGKIANGIAEHQQGLKTKGDKNAIVHSPRVRGLYWENEQFSSFACWVAGFEDTKNAGFLNRPGVVAEMLVTWIADISRAGEFWQYVFLQNHPDPDHYTRELAETYRDWQSRKKFKNKDYRNKAKRAWGNYLGETKAAA